MSLPRAGLPPVNPIPKEGDLIDGKYRIEKVLGQGGMGVVVAAQHTTLRQKVAIKLLLPEAAKQKDSSERFLREARAAASIQSEHVARVMDVGTLGNGTPYMAMEFLTGTDLRDLLVEQKTLPVAETVDYLLQACEAIAEAHSLGIIHRDLKPANLFLTHRPDGSALVKVLDFGLSKATKHDEGPSLTGADFVMGSPHYMSPEQIRSLKGLDARTDVWALGIILYQMLTGTRPFESPSTLELFFAIGADTPKPLRDRRPDIPPQLEAAILKCIEKDPNQRHRNVAELAHAIAPFGSNDARTSAERISRVLSKPAPVPASLASVSDDAGEAIEIKTVSLEVSGRGQPTVAEGRGKDGTQIIPRGSYPNAPTGNSIQINFDETSARQGALPAASPPVAAQATSGSMPAIAKDGSTPAPPTAKPSRAGLVIALVVAAALVGGLAAFGLSRARGSATTAGSALPTSGSAPATAASATGAPSASAAPTGEAPLPAATAAPTLTPSATPTEEPAPSASAGKPFARKASKLVPIPKKPR